MKLVKTVRTNRERIVAAVELNLSNSKIERLNSTISLGNCRGIMHHSTDAVFAMA